MSDFTSHALVPVPTSPSPSVVPAMSDNGAESERASVSKASIFQVKCSVKTCKVFVLRQPSKSPGELLECWYSHLKSGEKNGFTETGIVNNI